jgi:nucleoside 2-deoxyribosyltransferase
MKVYVAGPMTWKPQFNIPTFDAAAENLRNQGYEVISPAELDDPDTRAAALASPDGAPASGVVNGETWGDFLARDVKLIADGGIERIYVLPGWEESSGAQLETFVAARKGIPVYDYTRGGRVTDVELLDAWSRPLLPR